MPTLHPKKISRFQKANDLPKSRTNPVMLDTILDNVSKNTKYTRPQLNKVWNFILTTLNTAKFDGHETLRVDLFNMITYNVGMSRLREVNLEKLIESKLRKGQRPNKEKVLLEKVIEIRKNFESKLELKSISRRWPKLLEFTILDKEMPKAKLLKLEKFERTNELKRLLKQHSTPKLQDNVVEDQIGD